MNSKNVLGTPLQLCNCNPMTGWFRDGSCSSDVRDLGMHTVCAVMTDSFLSYSKAQGNDLSTPMPQYDFKGLKSGDRWCLCAPRWKEAYDDGIAPMIILEATDFSTLEIIDLEILKEFEYKNIVR
ncbi:DUF2237 domain-containing protein [Prochlorococcus sp. MIT 1223]|uniref:DUF2237 family protein n=1 Tax=Prochlorococcus sp. MIT 1223 TaxID=3096217 RepID=UPI002A763B69|nr:DUF2237 domain-containing protein [Prochlorococcus sp. MIT 1223]